MPQQTHPNGKKVSCMTALASFPSNIRVYGLNPDERILLFVREHRIIHIINSLLFSLMLLLPWLIKFGAEAFNKHLLNNDYVRELNNVFTSKYWTVLLLVWFMIFLRGQFTIFFKWFYNLNVLTTDRLLDLDLQTMFRNRLEETSIKEITDAKDVQPGLFQSIFHMGDLEIFTASGKTTFDLSNVPQSSKIRDFIMDVVINEKRKENNIP